MNRRRRREEAERMGAGAGGDVEWPGARRHHAVDTREQRDELGQLEAARQIDDV
jgi:hypothetical protein